MKKLKRTDYEIILSQQATEMTQFFSYVSKNEYSEQILDIYREFFNYLLFCGRMAYYQEPDKMAEYAGWCVEKIVHDAYQMQFIANRQHGYHLVLTRQYLPFGAWLPKNIERGELVLELKVMLCDYILFIMLEGKPPSFGDQLSNMMEGLGVTVEKNLKECNILFNIFKRLFESENVIYSNLE